MLIIAIKEHKLAVGTAKVKDSKIFISQEARVFAC